MTIGDRIKQRRLFLGLSVEQLAERLGKNRATVYRYESNDIENFPITIIEPLAKALNTTPAFLMGWEDNLESDTDFIATMFKDPKLIKYVEKLVLLSAENRKSIYDMIDFLSTKEGLQ